MNGSDGSDGRPAVRPVPGSILMWIVVMLAVLVAVGWIVETAAARSFRASDSTVAGAVPLTVAPPSASLSAPPGPPVSAGSTMPASDGASQPSNVGRVGPLPLRVAVSWIAAVAGRTGIPARALTAYANAQLATGAIQPGCHVSWAMLAGIGWVESGHGSHGGAVLRPDGTPSVPIVGPRLDGTNGTIAVRATPEGVRLDGDIDWDHAIGPMQFLPSTWIDWGVSADGGVPNPDDIDDAALTAANYLCANGHDLATVTGWGAALAAYNAPEAYATRVTDAAIGYARASLE